jgi:hypothetical protein
MKENLPLSILLDDDSLVRDLWTYVYGSKNKPFVCFDNPRDFFSALPTFKKTDLYYIDQDLGADIKGAEIARDLIANGYLNVYLASGHEPEDLPVIVGLKGFVGKVPQ